MVDDESTHTEGVSNKIGAIVAGVTIPFQCIGERVEGCSSEPALIDIRSWATDTRETNAQEIVVGRIRLELGD